MKYIFFCFFTLIFLTPNKGHSQHENSVWVFGYDSNQYPDYPGIERIKLNFTDSLIIEYEQGGISFAGASATICDRTGNLILLSNGCFAETGNGTYVENSFGINAPGLAFSLDCYGDTVGYASRNSMMLLPHPGTDTVYQLLHTTLKFTTQPFVIYQDRLNYTTIHYNPTTQTAYVSEKQVPVVTDSIDADGMHAVRHANGRDWWVVVPKEQSNRYYIVLITPEGFAVKYQEIGLPTQYQAGGNLVFSPDGTKMARYNTRDDLRVFDFDRCNGVLSNPQFIPISEPDSELGVTAGAGWSADGRYLYCSSVYRIWQFDMQASDWASSRLNVGELVPEQCPFSSNFTQMELGPDGRLYARNGNGAQCLHRIARPELGGAACRVEQNALRFQHDIASLDHYPNFRLGPVDGSACDTLGIDNVPLSDWRYDRGAPLSAEFAALAAYEPDHYMWDFGDGTGSAEKNPLHTFPSAGPYLVCLTVWNEYGTDTKCKTVWVHAVSASDAPASEAPGWRMWPNPSTGYIFIQGAENLAFLRIYDQLGKLVMELPVTGARIELSGLPNGFYLVEGIDIAGGRYEPEKLVLNR